MSALLDLPYELRETILETALTVPCSPPANPWTGADKREPLEDVHFDAWGHGPRYTLYDTSLQQRLATTCRALSLTSRQIHQETKAILQRLKSPSYTLDVMVVNEWELWPTWLSVPVVRTHVAEVNVTFRIFGHCITWENSRHVRGDGGHNGVEWCFYALLERFLVHGPVTEPSQTLKRDRSFHIKTLNLNIESAADEQHPLPPLDLDRKKCSRSKACDRGVSAEPGMPCYALRPEWLAKDVYGGLEGVLALGYHTLYYGGILYEHVGKIRLSIEGRLVEEIDLAGKLAPMKFDCTISNFSREQRREYFWRWKREALKQRQREGLSVKWPEDPEFADYP